MPIEFTISQNGTPARVTKSGELITSSLEYDETKYFAMTSTGTAYNFFEPKASKQFIITGFLAVSDKNITADAIVEIYEAESTSETTVLKSLPTFALTKKFSSFSYSTKNISK